MFLIVNTFKILDDFITNNFKELILDKKERKRINTYSTFVELVKKMCNSPNKKYAAVMTQENYNEINKNYCPIMKTQILFRKTYVSAGVAKNFKYKKNIDAG